MSTWCIGDLHACYDEFMRLLELIHYDESRDELLLTGDVIGRGPRPVETVHALLGLRNVHCVLGNHDLNFLAVCHGVVSARPRDNLEPLLRDGRLQDFCDFLTACPLLYLDDKKQLALAHAGIYPLWELSTARKVSKEIGKIIKSPPRLQILLRNMYGNEPNIYDSALSGLRKWRFGLNAFTRMRLLEDNGALDFKHNAETPAEAARYNLKPWFSLGTPNRLKKKQYTLIFGHWAALNGDCHLPRVKALDTGCVWGGALTAWCPERDKLVQVKSRGYLSVDK